MNLLIFTLSLIMILAAMSYARFESFVKSQIQAKEWRNILVESQRDLYNQQQRQYKPKRTPASEKPQEEPRDDKKKVPETEKKEKVEKTKAGYGQISLQWFFNPVIPGKEEQQHLFTELAKSLMQAQWGNQPFYKQMVQEHPDFVLQILKEITDIAQRGNVGAKKTIKSLDDLIYAEWQDPELKVAFGRMLNDGLVYEKEHQHDDGTPDVVYHSPKGFQSLKDYFTTKNSDKIRVWLAPRPILFAIFRDPSIVESVVQWRAGHYKDARKGDADLRKKLSEEFDKEFSSKTALKELLDWTVTTTDPGNEG